MGFETGFLGFAIASFLALVAFLGLWQSKRGRGSPVNNPLPPGPPPLPILGNILDVDKNEPWKSFTNLGKTYGELIYLRLGNMNAIVVSSEEVARDILERRSNIYSDRPLAGRVAIDFVGWAFNTVMETYGDTWRLHRKLLHRSLCPEVNINYQSMQLHKSRELVVDLLERPHDFNKSIPNHSASSALSALYGYETVPRGDSLVALIEQSINLINSMGKAQVFVLSLFPFIRYLPSRFLEALVFKRQLSMTQQHGRDIVEIPFQCTEKVLASGVGVPSMVSEALQHTTEGCTEKEYLQAVKESASSALTAGVEASGATLFIFMLAMVQHPEVQKRAQAEIDAVVGTERLPDFGDRPSLPYIEAVYRETLRWHPAAPLGIAHASSEADIYNGYFIPQGTTVFLNVWAITRNEAKYARPEEFCPERFFDAAGELNDDIVPYAFGAGRRICPGRHFAEASIWSAIVTILATLDIVVCKDKQGNDIPVDPKWSHHTVSYPIGFECNFVPRAQGMTAEKLSQMF